MASTFRARIQQALAEAEAKTAGMSEAEINARLGPATQRFFAASERIEAGAARNIANTGRSLSIIVGFIAGGFLAGRLLHTVLVNLGTGSPIIPFVVAGVFVALAILTYALLGAPRRNGSDVGYVPGFLAMIAASAGSGGDTWVIVATAGAMIGGLVADARIPVGTAPATDDQR